MNAFSTKLGIRLSFVKTSEFRGEGGLKPLTQPLRTPPAERYVQEVMQQANIPDMAFSMALPKTNLTDISNCRLLTVA
jgi:hypothetical protein